jgi:hypothetical protein
VSRKNKPKPVVDVTVSNEGTLFTFTPHTDAAQTWIDANIPDDARFLGKTVCVEHRYAENVANGMQGDGLVLE